MRKIPPLLLLDAWRGIAALWVVALHCCVPFLAVAGNGRFVHFPLYAVSIWGQTGVVMFFVISGYCIMGAAYGAAVSGRSVRQYTFDRARRIYPTYFIACMLGIVGAFIIKFAQSHHLLPVSNHTLVPLLPQPKFWLTNLLLIQFELNLPSLLFVAWSLCYEIIFYAMLGVLLWLARIRKSRFPDTSPAPVFQIGIVALTFLSLTWLLISPETCPFPLNRWYQFGLGSLLFFVFAAKPEVPAWSTRGPIVVAGILLILFAVLHPDHITLLHGDFFALNSLPTSFQAVFCLFFVVLLWVLRPFDISLAHHRLLRPLMWVGTISYSLYLVHPLAIAFTDIGGRRLGFDHERYWVTYFLQMAVSIAAGWVLYYFVERHFISSRQKQRIEVELKP